MKRFIRKTILFLIGIPLVYLLLYISIDYFYNYKNESNAIYVWGDSQTYRGLDVQTLKKHMDKDIYTSAKHGAGVYDFLIFTEKVPNKSTIILGVSKPVQLRPKNRDRNMSGISIASLIDLYKNGYTSKELTTIIYKNRIPNKILQKETEMYAYNDTIILKEPIELFENIYAEIPSYLYEKQNLYKIGITRLRNKKCNIVFVNFPYHQLLKDVENKSIIKKEMQKILNYIINSSKKIEIDTIQLDIKKQVMHDLTHLNEYGAKQVSIGILELIKKHERTTMYIKNYRSSASIKDCTPYEIYCKIEN